MLADAPRNETDLALLERSRFTYPEADYTSQTPYLENRFAEEKTVPRIFLPTEPQTHPEPLPQAPGTHQENAVCYYGIVLGCIVAPNSAVDPSFAGFASQSFMAKYGRVEYINNSGTIYRMSFRDGTYTMVGEKGDTGGFFFDGAIGTAFGVMVSRS